MQLVLFKWFFPFWCVLDSKSCGPKHASLITFKNVIVSAVSAAVSYAAKMYFIKVVFFFFFVWYVYMRKL